MMKQSLLFLLCAVLTRVALGQSSSEESNDSRRGKVGISVSGVRTMFSYKSAAYVLVDSTQELGTSDFRNATGIAGGVTFRKPLREGWSFRAAFEGVVTSPFIEFDSQVNYRERSIVFPLTVELPMMLIRHLKPALALGHEVGIGIRPAMAIPGGQPAFPKLKQYYFCIDASYGVALQRPKSEVRCELFASYCPINLIGTGSDYKTQSITNIRRNMIGVRFIFD
ncbi:MAG: hypothetical protein ACKO6L_01040 [Flavobacteriales bacterium]